VYVLLVEDDLRFAAALCAALGRSGYTVNHVPTVAEAMAAPPADLVLLDVTLPDGDGMTFCRRLRERSDVAVIMLTACAEERDRVAGLRSGADDYLVKPFGYAELQARIEAVTRRVRPQQLGRHRFGTILLDLDRHAVEVEDQPTELTRKEFDLLSVLMRQPGTVVSRDRLIEQVWHTSWPGGSRALDVHMAMLRAKLGPTVSIATVRGIGYRLDHASGNPDRAGGNRDQAGGNPDGSRDRASGSGVAVADRGAGLA
jgi:DNA-binding response OmpR family regulator